MWREGYYIHYNLGMDVFDNSFDLEDEILLCLVQCWGEMLHFHYIVSDVQVFLNQIGNIHFLNLYYLSIPFEFSLQCITADIFIYESNL